ncbi:MAG TPA: hypothetical protein VGQ08_07275 [Nitrospiraceae bacterium]|jgi:hypothetical protein|nr:hypothetical protein [Nitrospiraceae bacterium]
MPLKLEQERAGVGFELRLTIRREHQLIKQLSVEEPGIRLTDPGSISGLPGIGRNRDLLPYLEAHLKVFGDLAEIVPELVCGGRSVERRVVPHRPEQRLALVLILAILPQALMSKRLLGILAIVDLALPAFIRPCGSAEPDQRRE